jgi:hypothetical protein
MPKQESGASRGQNATKSASPAKTSKPKGGPAGANQGGASRGGSRVEPSHQQDAASKEGKKMADRSEKSGRKE